jgi:hypothetical protein
MTMRLRVAAAVAAGALAVGGCSGSEPADDRASATSATAASTTAVPGPSTTDPATEQMLIGAAFLTFFGGAASDVDEKVAVLQDGERYRSMIVDASANEQFQAMTVDIREIRLLEADACTAMGEEIPCAVVTHDLFVGGAPARTAQR